MSARSDILRNLLEIADNPENEFDKIISANKQFIGNMSLTSLRELQVLRSESYQLCRLVPFPREEIIKLLKSGEADSRGIFATLYNKFTCAEYILSYYNGDLF